jgi:maleylacetoacetate isomerase
MKLYQGTRSSASWRVRWALAVKKLDYEPVWIDIASDEHHTVLAGLSQTHQVPTLQLDDGRVLTESVAIIEWLEETRPTPALLPADPWRRAQVRERVELVNSGIHPLQNTVVRKAISPDGEAQRQWAAKWILRGLVAYEALLAAAPSRFSVGDTLTMADLFLVPQVHNAARYQLDVSHLVHVRRVYETCLALPEAAATAPRALAH